MITPVWSCIISRQFGSGRLVKVSIRRDRGQDPSNRECPDHIGAVSTDSWSEKRHNPQKLRGPKLISDRFPCV